MSFIKLRIAIPSILTFAFVFLVGCGKAPEAVSNVATKPPTASTPAPATPAPANQVTHDHKAEENAPRITLADAKRDFDSKTAVFIDTHPADQFALEHIPGAINIQVNAIRQNIDKVPKGKKIIVYCS